MANRNVSQLPENTDPQDTDWLLSASGDSPTVLQKIAVGNLPGSAPSVGGGSIKFALPINENYVLTSSGYYFTDAIAADIEIDCSNLEIGTHIFWINLSSKNLVFSGLNSIDNIVIPTNKGLRISSQNSINFFLKDANKNINKISGNYFIDWIPQFAPPTYFYWRLDFNYILSDIQFYYSDNPDIKVILNGNNIISFERSATYSTSPLEYNVGLLNNGSQDGYIGRDDGNGMQAYIIQIPTPKIVSAIGLCCQAGQDNLPSVVRLYRGNNPTNWEMVKEWTGNRINIADGNNGSKFLVS